METNRSVIITVWDVVIMITLLHRGGMGERRIIRRYSEPQLKDHAKNKDLAQKFVDAGFLQWVVEDDEVTDHVLIVADLYWLLLNCGATAVPWIFRACAGFARWDPEHGSARDKIQMPTQGGEGVPHAAFGFDVGEPKRVQELVRRYLTGVMMKSVPNHATQAAMKWFQDPHNWLIAETIKLVGMHEAIPTSFIARALETGTNTEEVKPSPESVPPEPAPVLEPLPTAPASASEATNAPNTDVSAPLHRHRACDVFEVLRAEVGVMVRATTKDVMNILGATSAESTSHILSRWEASGLLTVHKERIKGMKGKPRVVGITFHHAPLTFCRKTGALQVPSSSDAQDISDLPSHFQYLIRVFRAFGAEVNVWYETTMDGISQKMGMEYFSATSVVSMWKKSLWVDIRKEGKSAKGTAMVSHIRFLQHPDELASSQRLTTKHPRKVGKRSVDKRLIERIERVYQATGGKPFVATDDRVLQASGYPNRLGVYRLIKIAERYDWVGVVRDGKRFKLISWKPENLPFEVEGSPASATQSQPPTPEPEVLPPPAENTPAILLAPATPVEPKSVVTIEKGRICFPDYDMAQLEGAYVALHAFFDDIVSDDGELKEIVAGAVMKVLEAQRLVVRLRELPWSSHILKKKEDK